MTTAGLCALWLVMTSIVLIIYIIRNIHLKTDIDSINKENVHLHKRTVELYDKLVLADKNNTKLENEKARLRRKLKAIQYLIYANDVDVAYEGNNYRITTK